MADAGQRTAAGAQSWWAPTRRKVAAGVLVASLAGLVWLVIAATLSQSVDLLKAAAITFLALTAVWVYFQFWVGDVSSRKVAGWIGLGLELSAAATAITYWVTKADALPLISLAAFFAGMGWVLEWWRRRDGITVEGKWILLAGVVALVGAGLGLAYTSGSTVLKVWLVLLGLGVLAIPVGVNLCSEAALWRLASGSMAMVLGYIGAGFGVALVAIIVETQLGHSWTPVLAAAGIALLLLAAIASDTHLDVALIITSIALLASAPPQEDPPASLAAGAGSSALVAMGDSYMSGEGANRFYTGTDDAGRNECRRAPTAYASLAVTKDHRFDALTFLACSGARTFNVIARGHPQGNEPGSQIDQLKQIFTDNPGFKPKLVIISIGGNDAGFATIGETCLAPGNCSDPDVAPLFTENLRAVKRALVATFASLHAAVPAGIPIAAVPYPQPIANSDRGCEGLPLSAAERAFIQDFIDKLDNVVHDAADAEGLYYVDTMPGALAAAHRQLCDPANHGEPGLFPVALSSVRGLPSQRFSPVAWLHNSLHPNALGHLALLQAFEKWLDANPNLPPKPAEPGKANPDATDAPNPPCSFSAAGDENCGAQARKWEVKQVLELWPWLFAVIPALVGLWLFSVGLLSLRRRALIDAGRLTPPR